MIFVLECFASAFRRDVQTLKYSLVSIEIIELLKILVDECDVFIRPLVIKMACANFIFFNDFPLQLMQCFFFPKL